MTWVPDPASLATQRAPIAYVGAPPWDGGANCTGSFLRGTARLGNYLRSQFPIIHDVGGYACRPNTASPSETTVHGTGRALDLMVRRIDGQADPRGGEIANWLLRHAGILGLQLIIWDRTIWNGRNPNVVRAYTGPAPHDDHLHIELNTDGANERTPFFVSGLDRSATAAEIDASARVATGADTAALVLGAGALFAGAAAGTHWWIRGGKEKVLRWYLELRGKQ